MIDELYINGEKVDMGSSGITLKFNSNIFKDISKVVSNNSYTINLPRTLRNERILKVAGRPTLNDDFPRSIHTGKLYRDGFPIIEACNVHLLSIGDTIEVALTWGNSKALTALIDDGKNLNEIADANEESFVWNKFQEISDYGSEGVFFNGVLFTDIDFGLKSGETKAAIHPSVRASYIFGKLNEVYGLNVSIPESRKEVFDHLIFPLTSRNGGYANFKITKWEGSYFISARNTAASNNWYFIFNLGQETSHFSNSFDLIDTYMGIENGYKTKGFRAKRNGKVIVSPNLTLKTSVGYLFMGNEDSGRNVTNFGIFEYETSEEGIRIYNKPIKFDVSEGDELYMFVSERGVSVSGSITIGMIPDEVQYDEIYSVLENLPAVKSVDFLKTICNILGLYVSNANDTLVLTEFDKLEENKAIARNWSDKMMGEAERITFQLDDFAQRNVLKYKDEDAVGMTYNGVLNVFDKWLDAESTLVDLKFAGSLNANGRAMVKLYSYNEEGEVEYEDTSPRILMEVNNSGKSRGAFLNLSFAELVHKYYNTYQGIIVMPVVVKARFRLDASDVRGMDMAVPIYLKQFGKFYVIKEGILDNDNIFEVELIQM